MGKHIRKNFLQVEISHLHFFLSPQSELLSAHMQGLISEISQHFHLDAQSVFSLENDGESIKIETIRPWILQSQMQARLGKQIFYIEGLSRMTPQAQNACLKFFEEPGNGNIILASDSSLDGILDTILSRVFVYEEGGTHKNSEKEDFYRHLIREYREKKSENLIRYLFSQDIDKDEYIAFLQSLQQELLSGQADIKMLKQLHEDIRGNMKHNFQGKYILDSYILKL